MKNNSKYRWLNNDSQIFLDRRYLMPGVSVDQRVKEIASIASEYLNKPEIERKIIEYVRRGWYSFSSPIWSNFGLDRGLPISCFGSYVGDSISEISYHAGEVAMLSKVGGGTSGHFGGLRARGDDITDNGKSSGSVHFMEIIDKVVNTVSQGGVRRGNYAAYLDATHDDIMEFLNIRDEGHPIQDLSIGVVVSDEFMEGLYDGNEQYRKVWAKIIESRFNLGYPYIVFKGNVERNKPQVYKDKRLEIHASNLCSEIMEHASLDKTFTCCLSSMNALYYDEWKDTDAVEVMTYFLDAVLTDFIKKLEEYRDDSDPVHQRDFYFLERAYKFAVEHRSIGLGVLGYHSYLQANMIPFESMEAKFFNSRLFKSIQEGSIRASRKMAKEYGEPEVMKGTGLRNSTLQAVAPTTSSSFILGQVSQGIEPLFSNYYIRDRAGIKVTYKNPYLEEVLESKGLNTREVWDKIMDNKGSVQFMTEELTDLERSVFKTFTEISQMEVIIQASQRQQFIDQGQSLNVMIHPSTPADDVNKLMLRAYELGIKSLYYQHGKNAAQEFSSNLLNCVSCEA